MADRFQRPQQPAGPAIALVVVGDHVLFPAEADGLQHLLQFIRRRHQAGGRRLAENQAGVIEMNGAGYAAPQVDIAAAHINDEQVFVGQQCGQFKGLEHAGDGVEVHGKMAIIAAIRRN